MSTLKYLTIAALIAFVSCNKKEDKPGESKVPENEQPTSSINIDKDTVWNTVNVTVDASDPDGTIKTVELYANNNWIGTDSVAPYEFEWDTRKSNDGPIDLKSVVTDDQDAQTNSFKTVEIINTLLEYDLYAGYLDMDPNYKYFTYITSKAKQVLFVDQIEELPYKMTVDRPEEYDDADFDVHFVRANPLSGSLTSYYDFTPGIFSPVNDQMNGENLGKSIVTFKNIPPHDYFTYSSYSGKELKEVTEYKSDVYQNLNLGYLYIKNGETGLYKVIKNLSVGNTEVSLSAMGFQMEKHTLTSQDYVDGVNFQVFGHTGAEAGSPSLKLFNHYSNVEQNGFDILYHTPDIEASFNHYSSSLTLNIGDYVFSNEHYFDLITSIDKLNVTMTNGSYQLIDINNTISGDPYDVLVSYYTVNTGDYKFFWEAYSANGQLEFPVIPTEITQAFNKFSGSNFVFKDAGIILKVQDYDQLNGYESYKNTLSGRTGKSLKEGGNKFRETYRSFYKLVI